MATYATSTIRNLCEYMLSTGLPHRVTSTIGGDHAVGSLHYVGRAVDFAGPVPDGDGSPEMQAIANAFLPHQALIAELIYTPLGFSIKDGRRVNPILPTAHYNHVHVALQPNCSIPIPVPEVPMPEDVLPEGVYRASAEPVCLVSTPSGNGYWVMLKDGAVFAFGDARYLGGVRWTPQP